ncbi:MAG: PorT family protein [Cyclobacteriaceae bacterium]|nr:PorT family protein [Cyclobacteriaceae bacterium]
MKLKSYYILALVICATISIANGQIHIGATSGYNATFVLDQGLKADPRYNSTYTYNWSPYGISFGADLGQKFGLSLESIWSNQGQIYNVINTAKEIAGARKIDLQYVNLPLLLKFMGSGSKGVRANFNFGPQLSILTSGVESLTTQAGTYEIPEGVDFAEIQEEYQNYNPVNNGNGTYTLGEDVPTTDLLTKAANDFKTKEFQLAAAFGLDIDLSKHLYLTTQVRANYSLTDMRNEDIINSLKAGDYSEIFGGRANLLVGVQVGLHYYFGTLRSFR